MQVFSHIVLETWTPDFSSSDQENPTWTRARGLGVELCNSLERTEWMQNPVQVIRCEACDYTDCASGGYVHLSRLGDFVLWTTPQIDAGGDRAARQYAPASVVKRLGAAAIPESAWEEWRAWVPQLPAVSTFSSANGAALADAWSLGPGRPGSISEIVPMLRARLLACDTMEPDEAIDRVQRWIERLSDDAAIPVAGALRAPEAIGAQIETLYFDGSSEHDWSALAIRGGADFLLLDREHAFIPD